jgi:hypothetical protein
VVSGHPYTVNRETTASGRMHHRGALGQDISVPVRCTPEWLVGHRYTVNLEATAVGPMPHRGALCQDIGTHEPHVDDPPLTTAWRVASRGSRT